MAHRLHAVVLGSAAGGGFPQWNCRCPVCALAWANDPRVLPRTQSSLAVSGDGIAWVLLNASPDLRQQIMATPCLHPKTGSRHSPIAAVVLTNGDIDHIAGLLSLREGQPFRLHASAAILSMLDADPAFGVLNPAVVERCALRTGVPIDLGAGLSIEAFSVPGKVPLFLEGECVEIGTETEMTLGLDIAAGGRRMVYIPGCAAITDRLRARIGGTDLLVFDGTTYTDDEMVRLGLSPKTATRMGHLAMSGPDGSIAALGDVTVARRVFSHINNTNPALVEGSPERRDVEAAGWTLAFDGMELSL